MTEWPALPRTAREREEHPAAWLECRVKRSYGEPQETDELWESLRFDTRKDAKQVANALGIIGPGRWVIHSKPRHV